MLKVRSVYPSRKRVSAVLMPEHAAFSKTTGTVLGTSRNSRSHCNCSQECRNCKGSMLWPGRTRGTVSHPPSSEMCKAGGLFKEWLSIVTVSRNPLLLRMWVNRDCSCAKAHCLSRDICSERLCGKTSNYLKRKHLADSISSLYLMTGLGLLTQKSFQTEFLVTPCSICCKGISSPPPPLQGMLSREPQSQAGFNSQLSLSGKSSLMDWL